MPDEPSERAPFVALAEDPVDDDEEAAEEAVPVELDAALLLAALFVA